MKLKALVVPPMMEIKHPPKMMSTVRHEGRESVNDVVPTISCVEPPIVIKWEVAMLEKSNEGGKKRTKSGQKP